MRRQTRTFAVALSALCLMLFAGCSGQDGENRCTAPDFDGAAAIEQGRIAPRVADPVDSPETVRQVLGPEGGVIAVGRIAVRFPEGSLPPGKTEITLTAWDSDRGYYFTVEPKDFVPLTSVGFSYKLDLTDGAELSYNWNDGGWREPMPSWVSQDGTLLQTKSGFLGQFVVAPKYIGKGRAGW